VLRQKKKRFKKSSISKKKREGKNVRGARGKGLKGAKKDNPIRDISNAITVGCERNVVTGERPVHVGTRKPQKHGERP